LAIGILLYNGLASLRFRAAGAWADIDVQLKRRHDLIPTLVTTVQGHAAYERGTLASVVAARSNAQRAEGPEASGAAEASLTGALHRFFAVAEAYPDLRAVESFLSLQRQLAEVEDQIQNARRYYNAVVRDLNTRIAQFPSNLVASVFGFRPREFFGLDDPREGAAPRIDLDRPA